MKLLSRIGWVLIVTGAILFLSTIAPAGFVLILLGAPAVFVGHTSSALRVQQNAMSEHGADD
ncbi:MAG: hypothetical protein ACT4NL_16340 [Pseudomarimonas sp.]